MAMKLGKKEFKEDERDFKLAKYVDKTVLPTPPDNFNHDTLIKIWGMLANDTVGDCVIAGADHETMVWTEEGSGKPANFKSRSSSLNSFLPSFIAIATFPLTIFVQNLNTKIINNWFRHWVITTVIHVYWVIRIVV